MPLSIFGCMPLHLLEPLPAASDPVQIFITIFGNTQFREFTAVLPCGISGPNTRLRPPELQHCTQHCTLHSTLHSESAVRTALFDFALHSDCTRTALSDLSHTLAYIPSANYLPASLQLLASSHSFTYLGHVSRLPWVVIAMVSL